MYKNIIKKQIYKIKRNSRMYVSSLPENDTTDLANFVCFIVFVIVRTRFV